MINDAIASEFIFNKKYQLFLNFIDHTDQARNAVQYMESVIFDVAQKIPNQAAFHYLDVGCGYGDKTLSIINAVKQYHPVHTTAIDPSSELIAIFKEQSLGENINFACQTWENFQSTSTFHFISSIHTFYYINDWKSAINKMLNHLNHHGMICIALRSNDEVCQFKDYFFKKIYGDLKKELNFDELSELVKTMNVNYSSHIVESKLNIKDCLLENEKGKQLIEFLLRMPYSDIADPIKIEIKHYLETQHPNGYLTHQDGFIWITT